MNPKVFLLSYPTDVNLTHWMSGLGLSLDKRKALYLRYKDISAAEKLVIMAAKRCYKSFFPGMNANVTKVRDDPKEFIDNVLKSGHGSVLEHVNVTFAFEDVSRVFTHELVRHRAGCAYSQESLRYVKPNLRDGRFFTPSCLASAESKRSNMDIAMNDIQKAYDELTEIYLNEDMDFSKKKEMTSALRRILPMGMPTGIVATFNFRALRHIITMRTSIHAEEEIRGVFFEVAKICEEHWPLVFQDMVIDVDNSVTFEYGAC